MLLSSAAGTLSKQMLSQHQAWPVLDLIIQHPYVLLGLTLSSRAQPYRQIYSILL